MMFYFSTRAVNGYLVLNGGPVTITAVIFPVTSHKSVSSATSRIIWQPGCAALLHVCVSLSSSTSPGP